MLSVLIVDDNEHKIKDVVDILIQTGLVKASEIDVALAGLNARTFLLSKRYDLLILDLQIPDQLGNPPRDEHGLNLLQEIIEDDRIQMPLQIVGLTQFDELSNRYKKDFASAGVLLVNYERTSDSWKEYIFIQLRQLTHVRRSESEAQLEYDYDLGIVCALDVEFNAVQKLPWNFKDQYVPGDPTFYITGEFGLDNRKRKVVAAFCPRMGMSNAAITAMKIINNFRPKLLAMTGITGAVRGKVDLGDVIVADECWDWGMGKWTKHQEKAVFESSPHHLTLDADLRSSVVRLSRDSRRVFGLREECEGAKPATVQKIVIGPVASGSAVIADQNMTDAIRVHHRKLVGIEMESYAIYNAATECANPRPKAISIKAASDFADDQKDDQYRNYCCNISAKVLQVLMEEYINL